MWQAPTYGCCAPAPHRRCPCTTSAVPLHHTCGAPAPHLRCPCTTSAVPLHHTCGAPAPHLDSGIGVCPCGGDGRHNARALPPLLARPLPPPLTLCAPTPTPPPPGQSDFMLRLDRPFRDRMASLRAMLAFWAVVMAIGGGGLAWRVSGCRRGAGRHADVAGLEGVLMWQWGPDAPPAAHRLPFPHPAPPPPAPRTPPSPFTTCSSSCTTPSPCYQRRPRRHPRPPPPLPPPPPPHLPAAAPTSARPPWTRCLVFFGFGLGFTLNPKLSVAPP